MTWGEAKQITLQKLFAEDSVLHEEICAPYRKAMPAACNEGMLLLSTAGRLRTVPLTISQTGEESGMVQYDLEQLLPRFYLLSGRVYLKQGNICTETDRYLLQDGHILLLDGGVRGDFIVWCSVYPLPVSEATPDSFVLELDPEAAALLPLYMASQLCKDDDLAIASAYRSEFEAGRRELIARGADHAPGCFVSAAGWF